MGYKMLLSALEIGRGRNFEGWKAMSNEDIAQWIKERDISKMIKTLKGT